MKNGDRDEALVRLLEEASELAELEQWDEAFALLLELEPIHPEDPELLCLLGVAAQQLGADSQAYDYFRRCLAQEPESPILLATAGSGIAASDDPDAERVLRLAALTAPHLVVTRLSYGTYLAREGHFEAALAELEAAAALEPENPAVRLEYGVALLRASDLEAAILQIGESLSGAPDDAFALQLYGLALVEAGRVEEAVEPLLAASRAEIGDVEVQLAASLAAAAVGYEDEAWAALARADLAAAGSRALIREVEERIEGGPDAARDFLHHELAAPLLRTRLARRG